MENEPKQVYTSFENGEERKAERVEADGMEKGEKVSTVLKLPLNVAGTLAYATGFMPVAGWLSGLLMLLLERDRKVRFHALQALAIFGGAAVLQVLLGQTIIFSKLASLVYLVQFVVWLLLMYQTYQGNTWKLPYVGDWADRQNTN